MPTRSTRTARGTRATRTPPTRTARAAAAAAPGAASPRRPRRTPVAPPDAPVPVTRGSGNVYADLGFENPEEELAKAELARLIYTAMRERGLTQQAAARLMGVDQPKVSNILRGRLGGISTQRLLDCLTALGRDVEITVRAAPKSRKRGRLSIAAA